MTFRVGRLLRIQEQEGRRTREEEGTLRRAKGAEGEKGDPETTFSKG